MKTEKRNKCVSDIYIVLSMRFLIVSIYNKQIKALNSGFSGLSCRAPIFKFFFKQYGEKIV